MSQPGSPADGAERLAALPPLRDVITQFELAARKSLGQNFLLDLNLTGRIARAAQVPADATVIEVGPGPGGLTRALLRETPARQVLAIERDSRCLAALAGLETAAGGRLTLLAADALAVDVVALTPSPRVVVANLPYNIATPLLMGWLRRITAFTSLTLMFQKEVADRLVADPGSKTYGRLSVITGWLTEARSLFSLPPQAFTPPPKVTSCVVRLTPRQEIGRVGSALWPEAEDIVAMETVTAAAFGQRRKMLRSSLRALGDAEALLEQAALSPTARAEEIPVAGFVALARAYRRQMAQPAGRDDVAAQQQRLEKRRRRFPQT